MLTFRPEVLPPSSCKPRFSYRWRFLIRLRRTPREGGVASRKKNGRLRARPPSARAIPPRRPSLVDSLCQRVSIISILKKLGRDRLFECSSISTASDPTHVCRTAPGLVLKTKKKRAADAALFLNRYICWQSYASLKNFFLPT